MKRPDMDCEVGGLFKQLPEDGIEVLYVTTPRWYLEKSESDPVLQSHTERDCAENA